MDLGKHVYVQKPLSWSVAEARQLARSARKKRKSPRRWAIRDTPRDDARTAVEYIRAGAIGDVREVHVWTNRPLGYWPQGVPRPEPLDAVPLDRSRWNGPASTRGSPQRWPPKLPDAARNSRGICSSASRPKFEYHPIYHPFNWRGWVDWGVGAIGDMGAHLIDHSMWALDLGYPTTIETISTPFNGVCYPHATKTFYEFPARGTSRR